MSPGAWPVVVLVLAAVVVIAWPAGSGRPRHRALFPATRPADADPAERPPSSGHSRGGRQAGPVRATGRRLPVGPPNRRDLSRPVGTADGPAATPPDRQPHTAGSPDPGTGGSTGGTINRWAGAPRGSIAVAAGVAASLFGSLAGPVAAVVAAAYAALGARALLRRRTTTVADRLRRRRLDQLGALAADLRAGLPVPTALADENATAPDDRRTTAPDAAQRAGLHRIDRLTRAATRLADRTGAPLAELVDRIEADMRATDRGLASAAAQAAGSRATAWLLAGLPLGGVALGYGIGVDPLRVLLHTPVGAACAIGATGLQTVGLLWAERLGAPPGTAT